MKNALVSVCFTLNIPDQQLPAEVRALDDGTDAGRDAALEHLEIVMREGEWSRFLDYINGGEAEIEVDG